MKKKPTVRRFSFLCPRGKESDAVNVLSGDKKTAFIFRGNDATQINEEGPGIRGQEIYGFRLRGGEEKLRKKLIKKGVVGDVIITD